MHKCIYKDGVIQTFDDDGNITDGGAKIDNAPFYLLRDFLCTDEIKKGSFELELGVNEIMITTKSLRRIVPLTVAATSDGETSQRENRILYATSSVSSVLLTICSHRFD